MADPIKYSTTTPSGAILKSSTACAVVSGNYGPTSSTGWYSGARQTTYTIIKSQNGAAPLQYQPSNDIEFIQFCNTTASPSPSSTITTIDEALEFISNSDYMLFYGTTPPDNFPEGLPMNGLSCYLDSTINASTQANPGLWTDVSGNGLRFTSYGTALQLANLGGTQAYQFNGSGYFQCNDKYGSVNSAGGYTCTLGAWNMISMKMSTGLTSAARTGFRSKNGGNYAASYSSRSNVAIVPSAQIRVGTGYAGPVEGGNGVGAILTYNKMLSNTEINQVYESTRERFGL